MECYRAKNILLEMEIEYWCDYKMVDYICSIYPVSSFSDSEARTSGSSGTTVKGSGGSGKAGSRVGVSVTRAMGFPSPRKFTYNDAVELINKKLYGLIVARNGVIKEQRFYRSILHIWCQTFRIAALVKKAFKNLESYDFGLNVKTDIAVFLTVCNHKCIYTNKIPYERI